jgi:hypothetical protein
MPKFYFNLCNKTPVPDNDGTELPDVEAARSHAISVARELMFRRRGMLGQDWTHWTMSVRDHAGNEVFSFGLLDASERPNAH